MECPSCYENFDEEARVPRNLPCGHTFCQECLLKVEQKRLSLCPLCRTPFQKNLKAVKLPKNFIALELAMKHQDMMKKNALCAIHPKESLRFFCNTCKTLMCAECIFDHSGHEFVRKEESVYVLKENALRVFNSMRECCKITEELINKGENAKQVLQRKKKKDAKIIDVTVERIIAKLRKRQQLLH